MMTQVEDEACCTVLDLL